MLELKILLVAVGTVTLLLAAIGVVRLPDAYMRMSSSTKAATMGIMCLLLAVALHFQETSATTRALATILFVLLTAPVAAHMIGRAAYYRGVSMWEGTVADEFRRDLEAAADGAGKQQLYERLNEGGLEDTIM